MMDLLDGLGLFFYKHKFGKPAVDFSHEAHDVQGRNKQKYPRQNDQGKGP
jgi:hypothetical protein